MEATRLCYLDNNATTRVAPEVIEAMMPFWTEHWGNPSSGYSFGKEASKAMEKAREQVAALINADPREIIFTSCGTESTNTALNAALRANPGKRHIVTTKVEHSATLNYCKALERQGCEVTWLPVEPDGTIDMGLLDEAIRDDTAVVSMMWANNETGVLFQVDEIAAICQSKGAMFHTDAVQTPGKLKLDVASTGVDFMSLSAHKLHAPKGVGLLYVKRLTKFNPFILGGSQEKGRRGGTENVAYIVGFGRAAEMAMGTLSDENIRVRGMRDRLESSILSSIPNCSRNGHRDLRLPNTSNISFPNAEAEGILLLLDRLGICVSSGSACTTGSINPSHVLTAMGLDAETAKSAIRFSLGIYNTDEDVDYLLKHLPGVIAKLRDTPPAGLEQRA